MVSRSPVRFTLSCSLLAFLLAAGTPARAQDAVTLAPTAPITVVPHVVQYAGTVPTTEPVTVHFALYTAQTGGEPIWKESQSIAPDAKGRYQVLLGSMTQHGLPQEAFSTGEARWLGIAVGESEEAPRTVLVATPYALKASDAETIGGHPFTDFQLVPKDANGVPQTATAISQINVSSGILGGGTGPTVSLKLDPTYFQQLAAAFVTGISASSGIIATKSGTTYALSLSTPYFQNLAANFALKNGVQTFTGLQTFSNGMVVNGTGHVINATTSTTQTFAILGNSSSASDGWGIGGYATNYPLFGAASDTGTGDQALGVLGETENAGSTSSGVFGEAPNGQFASGVFGVTGGFGPSAEGASTVTEFGGAGVWGDSAQLGAGSTGGYGGTGILGTGDDQNGGIFANNSPTTGYYTVLIENDDTTGIAAPLNVLNSSTETSCYIDYEADLYCSGTISGSNVAADQHKVATYAVQSPESWIEDFGSGQMENGRGTVALDPKFAEIVNTGVDYHVFLTPRGDNKGLYIATQSGSSFEVRESQGGTSTLAFDYRIVAKRKGQEAKRLEDISVGMNSGRSIHENRLEHKTKPAPAVQKHPPNPRPDMVAATHPVR